MILGNKKIILGLAALIMLLMLPRQSYALEVIAHPSVSISDITDSKLRRIYTMKVRRWPDHRPIHLFVLPSDSRLHGQFTKQALKMFPYQLERIWNKLAFAGTGVLPTEVATQEEMIRLVNATPGAIGYIQSHAGEEVNVVYQVSEK